MNPRGLLLLLCGFLPAPTFAAVKNPDTLVYAHVGEVTSLDPVFPYDAISQSTIYNVYETLIAFDGPSLTRFVPALASRVPSLKNGLISKDGLTYAFPIRPNVRFHDGTLMTPEDVRYSLMRFVLTDRAGGPSSLLLEPILGFPSTRDSEGRIQVSFEDAERAIQVQGGNVVIRLKRPFAPFLSILARWSYVVPKSWAAQHGEWNGQASTWQRYNNPEKEDSYLLDHMNGTGPFILERWDRQAKKVFLKANEKYRRTPPALKRIVQMTVDEFTTRRLMLQSGDADVIDVPRPFLPQVEGLEGVQVLDNLPRLTTDPVFFFTLDINPQGNPDIGSGRLDGKGIPPDFFQDVDLRKAFAYSFDYDSFIRETFRGRARRAKGCVPPGLLGHYTGRLFYSYDPKKAVEHFRKAWSGKVWERGFQFTITFNVGGEVRETACQIMKKGVEAIHSKFGIRVRGLDWASYLDKTQARKMPLFTRPWMADYPDPHNFAFPFFHSQGRFPIAQGYKNPHMDAMIERTVRTLDPRKREVAYFSIQEVAYQEAIQIYTVHPVGSAVLRSWIKGFYDNPVWMGMDYYPLSKG